MPAIVPRAAWGARPPKAPPERIPTPTPELWIHHFGTEQHGAEGMRAVQRYHMDTKRWNDFAYSFAVDDDGEIYEGRGFGIAGGHTKGRNTVSHAIVFMGNLDARQPTEAAMASARWLIQEGIRQGAWRGVTGGHRDAPGARTACPGRFLYARLGELSDSPPPAPPTPAPPAPPAPAPAPPIPVPPTQKVVEVKVRVLKQGDTGGTVKSLQALLNAKAGASLPITGFFGPQTDKAVRNVQRFFWPNDARQNDGIVGANTWGVLFL